MQKFQGTYLHLCKTENRSIYDAVIPLDFEYHKKQEEFFFAEGRFKILAKGRRFGFTRGLAKYVLARMFLNQGMQALWVDTIYSNIERYFDRYFGEELKYYPKKIWSYNRNKNEFKMGLSLLDFRSADRPENIEGFGYHLIVINEAGIVLKKRNLWQESILPMVMDHKADVIIGGTPKGKRGKKNDQHLFYELFNRGNDPKDKKYESFNYSSYDNPLLDPEEIKELEREIPLHLREQEIRGLFIDAPGSGIIKRDWFGYFELHQTAVKRRIRKIQMWDTAGKEKQENDFSVCETWLELEDGYYLTHLFRERLEFPELKKKSLELYNQEKPDQVWIEDKSSGTALIQELKRNTRIPIKEISATKDKVEYVNAAAPIIEAGRVYLLANAPWLGDFLSECEEFPNGEFDDQIDAMAKFLNEAKGDSRIVDEIKIHTGKRERLRSKKYKGYRK